MRGLGYVLVQVKDNKVRLIECGSTSLTPAQRNYSVIELEKLSQVWSITKLSHYLKGLPSFTVKCDHKPLETLQNKHLTEIGNSRLLRLEEKILDYNYTVSYLQGQENSFADLCSRHPLCSQDAPDMPRSTFLLARRIITGAKTTPHNEQRDVEHVILAADGGQGIL